MLLRWIPKVEGSEGAERERFERVNRGFHQQEGQNESQNALLNPEDISSGFDSGLGA